MIYNDGILLMLYIGILMYQSSSTQWQKIMVNGRILIDRSHEVAEIWQVIHIKTVLIIKFKPWK